MVKAAVAVAVRTSLVVRGESERDERELDELDEGMLEG